MGFVLEAPEFAAICILTPAVRGSSKSFVHADPKKKADGAGETRQSCPISIFLFFEYGHSTLP